MTFNSRENSIADGAPVRLYEFSRGLLVWRYTTADRDVTQSNRSYSAVAISDNGIRQTGQTRADALEITAPHSLPVAQLYRGVSPSADISLTVRDMHYGDDEAVVSWVGTISGVAWPAADRCKIHCQSLAASFGQPGLRMTWDRSCPHSLYDRNCRVNAADYAVAGVIDAMDGAQVTASAFAALDDGYFNEGYVEWTIGSEEVERRGIEQHTGGVLVLLGGTSGLTVGDAITAYPGCPRTIQACNDKFANTANYGGAPHQPGRSPFDGNPVF